MLAAAGMLIISDWSLLLSTLCVTFQVDNMQRQQPCWFHSIALMYSAAEWLTVLWHTLPLCKPSCCMLTETKTVTQKQNNHTDLQNFKSGKRKELQNHKNWNFTFIMRLNGWLCEEANCWHLLLLMSIIVSFHKFNYSPSSPIESILSVFVLEASIFYITLFYVEYSTKIGFQTTCAVTSHTREPTLK